MTTSTIPELGFYTLAGQPDSARDLVDEVRTGEDMGLGHVFISERYNIKEAVTLSGAAGPARRPRLRPRHPDRHRRVRPQHAGPRRAGLRPGRAAHVLHRRDHGPL